MSSNTNLLKNIHFKEEEDFEVGFRAYFENTIKPQLGTIEDFRLEKLSQIKKRTSWAVIILLLSILLPVIFKFSFNKNGAIFYVFFIIGLLIWSYFYPSGQYRRKAKENLLPSLVRFFGDFNYQINGSIQEEVLSQSKIVPTYDRYESEDYIQGVYKGVTIELSESTLKKRRRTKKGKTRYVATFKGLFVLLDMNKPFKGKTIIKTDKGSVMNWLSETFSTMEKVALEDPKFEKIFEVYSTNQIESRYLLTTAFMERLLDLCGLMGSKKIQCSFFQNNLFIMIPSSHNFFEPRSVHKSVIDLREVKIFLKEMRYIFQIIDVLKMNQKIGL